MRSCEDMFTNGTVCRLLQNRISESLRFWKPASPASLAHLPLITAAADSESFSVRNFTVIENSVGNVGISRSVSQRSFRFSEEDKEEMRRRIEEDVKRKLEEEYRKKEEERRMQEEMLESRRREQDERRMEQERMQRESLRLQQETLRLAHEKMQRDMEAEIKRREEEERKRKEAEEANRRRNEEERKREETMRLQREQQMRNEAELRRKQEEERKREEKRKQEEAERKRKKEEEKLKCTFLQNTTLYLHTDPFKTYNERGLDGKIIGLLFSGFWCMPCQEFVPILNFFYQQVEDYFEVLFISSDRDETEMNLFLNAFHGRWFNLPFQSALGNSLKENLNVNSIPSLIIVRPNGQVISRDGRSEVQNCVDAKALVAKWMRT